MRLGNRNAKKTKKIECHGGRGSRPALAISIMVDFQTLEIPGKSAIMELASAGPSITMTSNYICIFRIPTTQPQLFQLVIQIVCF